MNNPNIRGDGGSEIPNYLFLIETSDSAATIPSSGEYYLAFQIFSRSFYLSSHLVCYQLETVLKYPSNTLVRPMIHPDTPLTELWNIPNKLSKQLLHPLEILLKNQIILKKNMKHHWHTIWNTNKHKLFTNNISKNTLETSLKHPEAIARPYNFETFCVT